MKAYTDLNQSKKLAEILPHNTADNTWEKVTIAGSNLNVPEEQQYVHNGNMPFCLYSGVGVPCWSLAALLDVLPTIEISLKKNTLRLRMDKGENDFNIWYENFDCGDVAEGLDVIEDNPVDACVEMIIKLHEQKFL